MDAEVAVIGVGTFGSMALWRLATRGVEAIGFERFSPGHDRGAVGGNTRLFRLAYMEGSEYVPLLQRSLGFWRELNTLSGRMVFEGCGGLNIGTAHHAAMRRLEDSITKHSLTVEYLDREAMAERFPQHRLEEGEYSIYDPKAGFIRSDQAVVAATVEAERLGVGVYSHTAVSRVEPKADHVLIEANGTSWTVGVVVIAMGSWSQQFLPTEWQTAVQPKRVVQTWFTPQVPSMFSPTEFPIFARNDGTHFVYGVPVVDGSSIKFCGITSMPTNDIEGFSRRLSPEEHDQVVSLSERYIDGLHSEPVRADCFTDLYSPDGHGILGRHPEHARVILATAGSGRGFKFSPAIGESLARMVVGEELVDDVSFMSPERL